MKRLVLLLTICCLSVLWMSRVYAESTLEGKVTVNISEDRANLEIIYDVLNKTSQIIAPNQADTFAFEIRNVATGEVVHSGKLDGAFQTNVSQYIVPFAHGVLAVKRIPIPDRMKANPGFYLLLLFAGYSQNGGETVFYVPSQSDYTLSASPTTVNPGATVAVSWTASSNHSAKDWIGLYKKGDANTVFLWWQHVPSGTSGAITVTAPITPGDYEFRYLIDNGYTDTARSQTVTVTQ